RLVHHRPSQSACHRHKNGRSPVARLDPRISPALPTQLRSDRPLLPNTPTGPASRYQILRTTLSPPSLLPFLPPPWALVPATPASPSVPANACADRTNPPPP